MLPTQLPAQDIQLVGLWLGGKGMTGASGQEPGEPFLGGDWDERAPCAENSALPFSTPQGTEAEVTGSLHWKTQIKPKRGLCLRRGGIVNQVSIWKLVALKNAYSGGYESGQGSRPKLHEVFSS